MLGVASHLSVAALESFASTFHMPVVIPSAVEPTSISPSATTLRPSPSPSPPPPRSTAAGDDRNYAIYVRPAYDGAIFALIRHFEWKHLYYLYDTEQGLSLSLSLFLISVFLACVTNCGGNCGPVLTV